MATPETNSLAPYLTLAVAIGAGLVVALWFSLVIWAFRDLRSRSRDFLAQILAALVVALLPLAGVVIYLILRPSHTLAENYALALQEEALLQQIEDRPTCPNCSRPTETGWILCPDCHTRLRHACANCDHLVASAWSLCPYCGAEQIEFLAAQTQGAPEVEAAAPQPDDAEPAPATGAAVAGDRRAPDSDWMSFQSG